VWKFTQLHRHCVDVDCRSKKKAGWATAAKTGKEKVRARTSSIYVIPDALPLRPSMRLRLQDKEEPAFTGARTILFMIGGMTYAEMRTAYDLSKTLNREVIVGALVLLPNATFAALQFGYRRVTCARVRAHACACV
jgi:hypothetical protein